MSLDLGAEDVGVESQILRLLAGAVQDRSFRRCHGAPPPEPRRRGIRLRMPLGGRAGVARSRGQEPRFTSSRTSKMPFFGPGTAPLTSSRFCSRSTECTVSPTCVTRLPPRRPAILIPLNTREGVAEAPTEPGLRTLCEPWEVGPRLKLCRLIVPAKPLPIETPETLTLSPGSKLSTVMASPSVAPVRPRSSSRCRCGETL